MRREAGADGGRCCVGSSCDAGGGARVPYCIKGCDFGAGDCSCRCAVSGTASGRDASCAANPYFNAKAEMRTDRSRQSRRRF